jgi:hypothetical protein
VTTAITIAGFDLHITGAGPADAADRGRWAELEARRDAA